MTHPNPLSKISVIGAGTMGRGIAQIAALAGYDVLLFDIDEALTTAALQEIGRALEKSVARGKTSAETAAAARQAITTTTDLLACATADLIIEAVSEKLALKQDIFRQLDAAAPPHTILASNTSSLSINALAGATQRPEQFLGLHFFNPVPLMALVEIIACTETSAATLTAAQAFVAQVGKTAVLAQDTPAFIVNRVARPFYGEAFRVVGEGQASVATVDKLMRSLGFRMGPFELIDLIGCDVNFAVTQSVYTAYFYDAKYRPHPIQQRMVESGRLGRKTGKGFYNY